MAPKTAHKVHESIQKWHTSLQKWHECFHTWHAAISANGTTPAVKGNDSQDAQRLTDHLFRRAVVHRERRPAPARRSGSSETGVRVGLTPWY
eukprot:2229571-Rhodomonas_salina.2